MSFFFLTFEKKLKSNVYRSIFFDLKAAFSLIFVFEIKKKKKYRFIRVTLLIEESVASRIEIIALNRKKNCV